MPPNENNPELYHGNGPERMRQNVATYQLIPQNQHLTGDRSTGIGEALWRNEASITQSEIVAVGRGDMPSPVAGLSRPVNGHSRRGTTIPDRRSAAPTASSESPCGLLKNPHDPRRICLAPLIGWKYRRVPQSGVDPAPPRDQREDLPLPSVRRAYHKLLLRPDGRFSPSALFDAFNLAPSHRVKFFKSELRPPMWRGFVWSLSDRNGKIAKVDLV
jgi:hypothetical protein